jgi:hypothetical protein
MLNSIFPGCLLNILKIEIKDKINVDKITLYAFNILNIQVSK